MLPAEPRGVQSRGAQPSAIARAELPRGPTRRTLRL